MKSFINASTPTLRFSSKQTCVEKSEKTLRQRFKPPWQILNRRCIEERSAAVETRKLIGHWETNYVIGKAHKAALVTLLELKSGLVLVKKIDFMHPDSVR
jgi:IS30 family transposase